MSLIRRGDRSKFDVEVLKQLIKLLPEKHEVRGHSDTDTPVLHLHYTCPTPVFYRSFNSLFMSSSCVFCLSSGFPSLVCHSPTFAASVLPALPSPGNDLKFTSHLCFTCSFLNPPVICHSPVSSVLNVFYLSPVSLSCLIFTHLTCHHVFYPSHLSLSHCPRCCTYAFSCPPVDDSSSSSSTCPSSGGKPEVSPGRPGQDGLSGSVLPAAAGRIQVG